MKLILVLTFLLAITNGENCNAQTDERNSFIQKTDSSLAVLMKIQNETTGVHQCLNKFYPVAVAFNDSLYIFDFDTRAVKYELIKIAAQPFPIPKGMQASFPLSIYDNKPCCVITPKTFSTAAGYATILHEFIHCCQFNSVETELKEKLEIVNIANENEDYSWEINHPFPYNDSVFINYFENYKDALQHDNLTNAKNLRLKLQEHLNKTDFEYLVWEEWKEGLARYVENKIREKLKLERNDYGKDKPYDRVAFYYSGELFIKHLCETNPELNDDMELLFEKMNNFQLY